MPVLCGTALKNKGVQTMIDAVVRYDTWFLVPDLGPRLGYQKPEHKKILPNFRYLPNPSEVENKASVKDPK